MTITEIILATLLFMQSIAWMATDYRHFDPRGTDD
ncbi:UNVERIFIED_ORG: hypothetical protein FNL38_1011036 [Nocardia globerula]|uniref:Uncharacterized protein n=1 Tax=Nocardia globerula TaxID=1818 RepID=A0A652YYA2_NOCGL|nr:hypothetical protein C8E04_2256 [Rhodococcus globerulus]